MIMAMGKQQKVKFVEAGAKELSSYKLVGVVPLASIPDRLVQKSRNGMRQSVRFIMGRKTLLSRILESNAKTKHLSKELTGTSAILLSNDDPFAIYKSFKANTIKLAAKPNQTSPEDIPIHAAETSLQPGQTVTELKQAGIDVQIQKGKVVIAKDKILVKKGEKITPSVAKALKILDIMPFSATILPSVMFADNLNYTQKVLSIDQQSVLNDILHSFRAAFEISMKGKLVNAYTIRPLLTEAFRNAMALGVEAKIPEKGIIERVVANAALGAAALNNMVKLPEKSAGAAPPASA
jgi:large subunit ribosomal protein L10